MSDDVSRSEGEPHDRKTRLANEVARAIDVHPDFHEGDQVIVVVSSDADKSSGIGLFGFEDDKDAIVTLFITLRAICRSAGKDLAFIGIPDDAAGIDDVPSR
jgi:hypothetical protein